MDGGLFEMGICEKIPRGRRRELSPHISPKVGCCGERSIITSVGSVNGCL